MPSILRNNSRYRRDQRQPTEEEEMWFNEEDDFEDVPTDTKIVPDLDNSISNSLSYISSLPITKSIFCVGKIMDKKSEMLKSHLPPVASSPNHQQQSLIQTIVNSSSKNINANNHNRKSSETVTSSLGALEDESLRVNVSEHNEDALGDNNEEATAKVAQALAAALGEEGSDKPLEETEPFSLIPPAESATETTPSKEPEATVVVPTNEETEAAAETSDDSSALKKVKLLINKPSY